MNSDPLAQTQERARQFNEREVIQNDFEQRRAWRRFAASTPPWAGDVLDDLDWMKALATCRQTRAIAIVIP